MPVSQLVCTKAYSGIPFAHRAPFHDGHCRLVHGHNWDFVFTFKSVTPDCNNFVFDFGKLKDLKAKLNELDHALIIAYNDPALETFFELEKDDLCKLVILPSTSCEGIAEYFLNVANDIANRNSSGRVKCIKCTVIEDENNSATYVKE
jgi:6-pyruvoyltetrahydropterin/6-carboxytetrahydropterin synthase